jgi:hypothetical protein
VLREADASDRSDPLVAFEKILRKKDETLPAAVPPVVLWEAELPPAEAGRGDKVAGSEGEAAATAAVDEEDTEGKETGTAGGGSAGETAMAEED